MVIFRPGLHLDNNPSLLRTETEWNIQTPGDDDGVCCGGDGDDEDEEGEKRDEEHGQYDIEKGGLGVGFQPLEVKDSSHT